MAVIASYPVSNERRLRQGVVMHEQRVAGGSGRLIQKVDEVGGEPLVRRGGENRWIVDPNLAAFFRQGKDDVRMVLFQPQGIALADHAAPALS
jgi:hypothetical protein